MATARLHTGETGHQSVDKACGLPESCKRSQGAKANFQARVVVWTQVTASTAGAETSPLLTIPQILANAPSEAGIAQAVGKAAKLLLHKAPTTKGLRCFQDCRPFRHRKRRFRGHIPDDDRFLLSSLGCGDRNAARPSFPEGSLQAEEKTVPVLSGCFLRLRAFCA